MPEIPERGYQILQFLASSPITVNGVEIDVDVAQTDARGGQAQWLRSNSGS